MSAARCPEACRCTPLTAGWKACSFPIKLYERGKRNEAAGRYFRKWLAPTLRSLAATPERAAEIDSNEGVLDVIEVKFPAKGSLITPHFGRPTGMRFFLMLRSLGAFAACLSKATAG